MMPLGCLRWKETLFSSSQVSLSPLPEISEQLLVCGETADLFSSWPHSVTIFCCPVWHGNQLDTSMTSPSIGVPVWGDVHVCACPVCLCVWWGGSILFCRDLYQYIHHFSYSHAQVYATLHINVHISSEPYAEGGQQQGRQSQKKRGVSLVCCTVEQQCPVVKNRGESVVTFICAYSA